MVLKTICLLSQMYLEDSSFLLHVECQEVYHKSILNCHQGLVLVLTEEYVSIYQVPLHSAAF